MLQINKRVKPASYDSKYGRAIQQLYCSYIVRRFGAQCKHSRKFATREGKFDHLGGCNVLKELIVVDVIVTGYQMLELPF